MTNTRWHQLGCVQHTDVHIFTQTHKRIIYNVASKVNFLLGYIFSNSLQSRLKFPCNHLLRTRAREALEDFKEFVSSQKTIKINPLLFTFKPYFCKGTCTDVYRRRYNVVEAFGLDHRTHSIKHVGHYNKSDDFFTNCFIRNALGAVE